jgi:hypothetical protein
MVVFGVCVDCGKLSTTPRDSSFYLCVECKKKQRDQEKIQEVLAAECLDYTDYDI